MVPEPHPHFTFVQFKDVACFLWSVPLYLHLTRVPFSFTKRFYLVGSASNRCSIEMDGLLTGGRSLQIGRRATSSLAGHPFSCRKAWPDEEPTRSQLIPYHHQKKAPRCSTHLYIYIYIYIRLKSWLSNVAGLLANKKLVHSLLNNFPPELCCDKERRHSTVSSCKNVRRQQRSIQGGYLCPGRPHVAEGDFSQKPRKLKGSPPKS